MEYRIFQVKQDMKREFGFMGLDERSEVLNTETISLNQIYAQVYSGEVEVAGSERKAIVEALEKLFETFNIHRPADFHGHSLSVGDVVKLGETFYYCDSFGWTDVTNQVEV